MTYANSVVDNDIIANETIETALRTYEKTIAKFMDHGHKLAPMEGSK